MEVANEGCNIIGVVGDRLILKSVVRFIINLLIWSHSPVNVHPPALHRSRHPRPQDNSCFPSG